MSNTLIQQETSKVHKEVLGANEKYVSEFGKKGDLALPPARSFTILTCMDARLDPAKYAGLSEGDAHVIRNAGGRASDDAIRSLVISYKLLGTKEFFVIHHSDCGMQLFTDPIIRNLLSKSLKTATIDSNGWRNLEESGGSEEAKFIPFLTFENLEQSVIDDVKRIRNHPLIPKDIPVYGYYYDVKTGKLVEVAEATKLGRASK
ncbi:carbonic anhydrase [Leptospira sp. 201903074]|uniref:beta-class carbonic anhydrase n=1 Tax=Leptospira abararensis TaxID=2810036 RepID=UPI001962CA79|nr:carbonic anhydrase [Leptospira abararensis]MBM9548082.1 carbonic anhydrase [Leptospira abararensis]